MQDCNPMAKLQKLYLYIFVFTLHFAVSFIPIQPIVLHIFVYYYFFSPVLFPFVRYNWNVLEIFVVDFLACYYSVSFCFINLRSVPLVVLVQRASLHLWESNEIPLQCECKSNFVQVTISPPKMNTDCSSAIVSCRRRALGAIIRAIILAQSVSLWFWLYIFSSHRRHLSAPAYE